VTAVVPWREGVWHPDITALVDAVIEDWPQIDAIWELVGRRAGIPVRLDASDSPRAFLAAAFSTARDTNLLRRFASKLIQADLVREGFEERLAALLAPRLGPTPYELQAFQNGVYLPVDALVHAKGLLRACEYVCRIDIDSQQTGTGVLVHESLVATAAHVVWDLVAKRDGSPVLRANGSLDAAPDTVGRLTVTFGDVEDYLPDERGTYRRAGDVAQLHPDWLAWGSRPARNEHPDLRDIMDVHGISSDQGPWDLVLIRLAERRRLPEPWLLADAPPSRPFQINLLHHPNGGTPTGEPLLLSTGQLDRQLGQPPVRCLHDANTLGGSSGAPIFDSQWRVVALHQAGQAMQRYDAPRLPRTDRNRAVPIQHWRERLDAIGRALVQDVPYVRELRGAPDLAPYPYPVIGRRETQRRVWRAMQPDATPVERVLILRGQPGTGLRFTKRLVRELVTSQGCLIAALDMVNVLDEDAVGFARRAAGVLSGQLAGAPGSGLTTGQREIRTDLVPSLGRELEQLADGRPTFLVLEGFDAAWLNDPPVIRDLLLHLIRHLAEFPLLRLVLVGWLEEPPPGFATSVENLSFPTAEDVVRYFTPAAEEPDGALIAVAEALLQAESLQGLTGYTAARRVIEKLAPLVEAAIAASAGEGGRP
jgi:hypothetical protein